MFSASRICTLLASIKPAAHLEMRLAIGSHCSDSTLTTVRQNHLEIFAGWQCLLASTRSAGAASRHWASIAIAVGLKQKGLLVHYER